MHGRIALLGALLLLLAPAAHAAAPLPGMTYEGDGPKGGGPVSLLVSKNGARVTRMSGHFERGCRVNGRRLRQMGSLYIRNARIRNGRFSFRRSLKFPRTGGFETMTFKGRFTDGGAKLVGTVRERLANPQTKVRCDSGNVRITAAVAERHLVNGDWAGTTGQGRPLTLTITPEGVTRIAFEVALTCRNGEQLTRALTALREPAHLFDSDLTFRTGAATLDTEIAVEGTARRRLVSGTITATDAITRPDGEGDERTYSCESGPVSFEARRRG